MKGKKIIVLATIIFLVIITSFLSVALADNVKEEANSNVISESIYKQYEGIFENKQETGHSSQK